MERTAFELREVFKEQEHERRDVRRSVLGRVHGLAKLRVAEPDVDWLIDEEDVCAAVPGFLEELGLAARVRDAARACARCSSAVCVRH